MGLVEPAQRTDQREVRIRLTAAGEAVLARSIPLWETAQETFETRLGTDGAAQLHALLGAL
jgi:DNA-binding MarR family transcriptional regulator